jgi:hypothetical protein
MSDNEKIPTGYDEFPDTMRPIGWLLEDVLGSLTADGEVSATGLQRAREVALRDSESEVSFMEQRAKELQELLTGDPDNQDYLRELQNLQRDYRQALIDRSNLPGA